MNDSHRTALLVLQGLRIRSIGRAADLLWMHFGDYRISTDRRGKPRQVGEWALHIECPWRFVDRGSIPLSRRDYHFYPEGEEQYDWDRGGESLFDRRASQMNRMFDTADFRVTRISIGHCDAFDLHFGTEFHFAVFPMASANSPCCEFWRLFRPDRDEPHYVVSTDGIENG